MSLTGQGLADFAVSKLGTPYVYGAKGSAGVFTQAKLNALAKQYPSIFTASYKAKITRKKLVGKVCCDCSGLISWYTGKDYGSSQLYQVASSRKPIKGVSAFPVGTVLWKNGHVGVYIGMENGVPMCIEEKGIDYGCVKTKVSSTRWVYGLTFSWITYEESHAVVVSSNPYKEPTVVVKKGSTGDAAKWAQYELREAGFGTAFTYGGKRYGAVVVDGDFGSISDAATKAFQTSCKVTADGIIGPTTRKYLIANK